MQKHMVDVRRSKRSGTFGWVGGGSVKETFSGAKVS